VTKIVFLPYLSETKYQQQQQTVGGKSMRMSERERGKDREMNN